MIKTTKFPKYKSFDGKVFTKDNFAYKFKSNATDTVRHYRSRGFLARKIKIGKKWHVYYKQSTRLQDFKRFKSKIKQKRKATKQARIQRKTKRKK